MPISATLATSIESGAWIGRMFMEGAQLKAQYGAEKVFDFTIGNPPEGPPPECLEALKKLIDNPPPNIHAYMPNAGFPEVREAISRAVDQDCAVGVQASQVVMTCGAGGAINVALKSLLDPGDEVLILAPYFLEYPAWVANHGGISVVVNTDADFLLDIAAIERAITQKTKAIILNSPNNPTGVVYPADQIAALGDLIRDRGRALNTDIYVINDEPYRKYRYDGIAFPHIFKHIDNALIAYSHSKDLCLGGERIGYLVASPKCADLQGLEAAMVFANRSLGFVNAPSLMQHLVAKLQHVMPDVAEYQRRRDLLYEIVTSSGFETAKPQGGFYLFAKSPIVDDIDFLKAANRKRLLLAPGTGFHAPGYFRAVFCVPLDAIERSRPVWQSLAEAFHLR
ncbi:MAG: pyridoxal phosphate-dependent aminotransferase [Deltaproteobacteria bacterium]|nr:pyridoxal phosphate-dependent aminotransferase [Deltaproteobacteria bacterium]